MCHVEEGKIEDQYMMPDELGTREDSANKNRIISMAREYYINELTQPFGGNHNDLQILSNSMSKEDDQYYENRYGQEQTYSDCEEYDEDGFYRGDGEGGGDASRRMRKRGTGIISPNFAGC